MHWLKPGNFIGPNSYTLQLQNILDIKTEIHKYQNKRCLISIDKHLKKEHFEQ